MDHSEPRAKFAAMTEGTPQDWGIIAPRVLGHARSLPDRVLDHLRLLDGDFGGFPIDRLQHSLQCATRAHRDGREEAYVVMSLLHDIGDTLATLNHPELAAAILKPYVTEELHWICAQHGVFQGLYYFHFLGGDQNAREAFRGHPHFEATAEFCAKYDQSAFDPAYPTEQLAFFEPMLRRVLAQPLVPLFPAALAALTAAE